MEAVAVVLGTETLDATDVVDAADVFAKAACGVPLSQGLGGDTIKRGGDGDQE